MLFEVSDWPSTGPSRNPLARHFSRSADQGPSVFLRAPGLVVGYPKLATEAPRRICPVIGLLEVAYRPPLEGLHLEPISQFQS